MERLTGKDERSCVRHGGNAYVNRPGPRLIDSADRFAWAFADATLVASLAPMPSGIARIN